MLRQYGGLAALHHESVLNHGGMRRDEAHRVQPGANLSVDLLPRKPPHDLDQLALCVTGGITEFASRMRVGKPAQTQQLTQPLAPIEL